MRGCVLWPLTSGTFHPNKAVYLDRMTERLEQKTTVSMVFTGIILSLRIDATVPCIVFMPHFQLLSIRSGKGQKAREACKNISSRHKVSGGVYQSSTFPRLGNLTSLTPQHCDFAILFVLARLRRWLRALISVMARQPLSWPQLCSANPWCNPSMRHVSILGCQNACQSYSYNIRYELIMQTTLLLLSEPPNSFFYWRKSHAYCFLSCVLRLLFAILVSQTECTMLTTEFLS
jgi:hypothetical protein